MQTRSDIDLTHLTYQDLLQQLSYITPNTPPITVPTTMSETNNARVLAAGVIPRFKGRDDIEWLDTFELAMLDRGLAEDDQEMAKYFARLMGKGPPQSWYNGLDDETKSSYDLLKAQWHDEFDEETSTKLDSTLTRFLALRLPDPQVGAVDPVTRKYRHVTFADHAADLATDIPSSEMSDRVKTRDLYERMGPSLRTYLYGLGHHQDNVKAIAKVIRDLTPDDINQILEPVRTAHRIRQLEDHSNRSAPRIPQVHFDPPRPPQQQFDERRPPMQATIAPAQPQHAPNNTYATTSAHLAEIRAWEEKYGRDTAPTLETQYPLTPDTSAPATGECFRCGKRGHKRKECQGVPIPVKEGNYRYLLYLSKQNSNQTGPTNGQVTTPATSSNSLPLPLRAMNVEDMHDAGDNVFSHDPAMDVFYENSYLAPENGRGYPQ